MKTLVKAISAMFRRTSEADAELVFWLNGFVSVGIGIVILLRTKLTVGAVAAITAGLFVLLLAMLLSRTTAIVAGAAGSLLSGAIGALLGASFGFRWANDAGAWLGGVGGGSAFFVVAAFTYRRLFRTIVAAKSATDERTVP